MINSDKGKTVASRFGWFTTALLLGLLIAPAALLAGDEALPKGEDVVDDFVKATGGKAAYAKIHNSVSKMTLEFVGMGIKASVIGYSAEPNKSYAVVEADALGRIEEGTIGEVAWSKSMMEGPQIKEGEERAGTLRRAVFDSTPGWRKVFKKAECVGVETVNDKPCYKVVMTPNEGKPETRYYEKESKLLVKTELTITTSMGDIPLVVFSSDYREVDGIKTPFVEEVTGAGPKRRMTTESIEYNVDMPEDRFDLPDEIKELLKERKAESGEES